MKAQKQVRSVAKTPGEWAIMYHNALEVLSPGIETTLAIVGNPAEGRLALRSFHAMIALLPKFPLHPSARRLAGLGDVVFRGRLIELNAGACGVVIACKHDPASAITAVVQNLSSEG
jgi:hypothetical protein